MEREPEETKPRGRAQIAHKGDQFQLVAPPPPPPPASKDHTAARILGNRELNN